MWEEVDCDQHNGRIIEYIVIISNNSNTYNMTSTEGWDTMYIIVNDLAVGSIYSISVAAVNSIGNGPFVLSFVFIMLTSTTTSKTPSTGTITGLSVLVGILIITQLISGIIIVLLAINFKKYKV